MLGALALLGLAALAAPRRRGRLGDVPQLPSGDAPPSGSSSVYLLRPQDFVHPAQRAQVEAKEETEGRWAVVPSTGWAGARHFATAREARTALRAAGYKGPYGKGTSSRWVR